MGDEGLCPPPEFQFERTPSPEESVRKPRINTVRDGDANEDFISPPASPMPMREGVHDSDLASHGKSVGRCYTDDVDVHKDLLEKMLRCVRDSVCVVDSQGTILAVNVMWRRLSAARDAHFHTGLVMGDVGWSYLNLCRAADSELAGSNAGISNAVAGISAVLAKTRNHFTAEFLVPSVHSSQPLHPAIQMGRGDGGARSQRWFSLTAGAFAGSAGRSRDIVITQADVTDCKAATARVARLARQLHRERKQKLDKFERLVDDLRDPLNSIVGMLEIARGANVSQGVRDCLNSIAQWSSALKQTAAFMTEFMDEEKNMLVEQMERAVAEEAEEGGGMDPPTDFRPRQVVDALLKSVAPYANTKGVDLWVAFSPAVPLLLHGRPLYVHKVLGYLLDNAIHATSKGDVCVTIGVASGSSGASGGSNHSHPWSAPSLQAPAQASPYASQREQSMSAHASALASSSSNLSTPASSMRDPASSSIALSSTHLSSGNASASISNPDALSSAAGPPSSAILIPSPSFGRLAQLSARGGDAPPGPPPGAGPGLSRRSSLDSLVEGSDNGDDGDLGDRGFRSLVLEFRVEDSGCGIAGVVQQELSGGLRRGDPYSFKHFGRGLTAALAIVSQAGGRIWFDSKVGVGTTFRFTLPCELPPPPTPSVVTGYPYQAWDRPDSGGRDREGERETEGLRSTHSDPTPLNGVPTDLVLSSAGSMLSSVAVTSVPPGGGGDGALLGGGAGGEGGLLTSLPPDTHVLVALESLRGRTLLQALLDHWGAREVSMAAHADALAHALADLGRSGGPVDATLLLDLAFPSLAPLFPALMELKAKGARIVGLVKAGRTGIQEAERLFGDCRLGLVVTRPWNAEELLQALVLAQDDGSFVSLGHQVTPRTANAVLSPDQWHDLVLLSGPSMSFPSAPTAVPPSRSFTRARVRGAESAQGGAGISSAPLAGLPVPSSPPSSTSRRRTHDGKDLGSVPFLGGASSPMTGGGFGGFHSAAGGGGVPIVGGPAKDMLRRNSLGTLLPDFRAGDITRRSTVGGGSTPVYAQQYLSGGGGAFGSEGTAHGGESERRPVRSVPISPMHASSSSSSMLHGGTTTGGGANAFHSALSMSGHLRFLSAGAPDSPTQGGGSSSSGGVGGGGSPALVSSPSVRRRAPQRQLSENFGTMLKKLFAADRGAERGMTPTSVTPPGYPGLSLAMGRLGAGERATRSDEASPCGVGGMNIAQQLRAANFGGGGGDAGGGGNVFCAFGSDRMSPGGSAASSTPGSRRLSFDKEGEKEGSEGGKGDGRGGVGATGDAPSSPRRAITLPSLSPPFARLRKSDADGQKFRRTSSEQQRGGGDSPGPQPGGSGARHHQRNASGVERFTHVGSGTDLLRMGAAGGTDALLRTAGAELFCPTPSMEGVGGGGMYSQDGGWGPNASSSIVNRTMPPGCGDDEIRY